MAFKHWKVVRCLRNFIVPSQSEESIRKMIGFANENTRGDYLEFGVYSGSSMISAFHSAKEFKLEKMNFYGFDSFEGLPKPTKIDEGTVKKGEYNCSIEKIKQNLRKNKCDMKRMFLIKGWFKDSLKNIPKEINKVSVINIDCDYYESTKDVFKFITPYLQEGTLIRFDDWGLFKARPDKGEQKAFNEFKQKCKEFSFIEWYNEGSSKIFLTLKK